MSPAVAGGWIVGGGGPEWPVGQPAHGVTRER